MGLGKSVITLTALHYLFYDRPSIRRVLIIAPKKVAESTWTQEARKWDHLKILTFSKMLGSEKQRIEAFHKPAQIYIINRENVQWLVDWMLKKEHWWPFDTIVIDELSSFKNPKAKRFRALKKVLNSTNRIIGLTGTPAANNLLDLWAEIYLLDQGERLGRTYSSYRDQYFIPDQRNRAQIFSYKPKFGAMNQIAKQISDITLTMKQEDYLQLPDVVVNEIPVEMTAKEQQQYDQMEKDQLAVVQDMQTGKLTEVTALQAGAVMNKLLQLASGFVYDENKVPYRIHTEKLDTLQEIFEDQKGINNLLVFYNFQADKDALLERFPEARLLESDQDLQDWNQGAIPMLLAHPASVGYGLNLQAGGHIIIWYSLTWSLEQYTQANARLHRQGQNQTVIIQHLITRGTVDEDVLQRLQQKNATQNALLNVLKSRAKQQTDTSSQKG